ncbi:MAG TPA: bifunctional 4-hydroxy-2-oxoglutarate aldolase/2-dehydro-3-deoxy-phosphogluconate aldolase [Segetibacter sp.]|jgi:2-dehydro-3-deoxyphosphogluconate aldolase/(4S)-4-hydroxy-2-oxoglutarate aldolase
MDKRETIQDLIGKEGLLPLFYHNDVELCIEVVRALYDAGVRIVEFTNRGKNALTNFKVLIRERDASMPGLMMGIGTIKSSEDATNFIDAGADVLISPTFNSGVADVAYMNKVLWIPGCMTPTEIHVAENAGCTLIKLFPGNVLGTSYVPAIKPLFPGLRFVITGGVETSKENLASWFKSGVVGVGMGSKLITEKILADKDYNTLTNNTKEVLQTIQSLKS